MRPMIGLFLAVLVVLSGCSGIQGNSAVVAQLNNYSKVLAPMSQGADTQANDTAYITTSGVTISGSNYSAMSLVAWDLTTTVNFFTYAGGRASIYATPANAVILQRVAHGAAAACTANLTADQKAVVAERFAADTETLYAFTQGAGPPNLASLKFSAKHVVRLHQPGKLKSTPVLTWSQIQAMIPSNLLPLAQPFAAVLETWTAEEITGWVAYLQADSDTALTTLYGNMTPDQLVVQIEADGQALDAAAIQNAADIQNQKNLVGDALKAAGNIIEAVLASLLGGLL